MTTCGHESNVMDAASWMEFDEDFDLDEIVRVVAHGVLCPECYAKYREWGILLESPQAEQDWRDGKTEYPK